MEQTVKGVLHGTTKTTVRILSKSYSKKQKAHLLCQNSYQYRWIYTFYGWDCGL